MVSVNEIEALDYSIEEKTEKQTDRIDLYIKIIFTILPQHTFSLQENGTDFFFYYADNIQLTEVKNELPADMVLFDSNHTTLVINCEDLLASELGVCGDALGLYLKTMESIQLVYDYLNSKIDLQLANVHFVLYSFDYNRDLIDGFSFLVDEDSSLNVSIEEYASYIINTESIFQDFKDRNWFLYIDYVGIFDYYQIYQPVLKGYVGNHSIKKTDDSLQSERLHGLSLKSDAIEEYSDSGYMYTSDMVIQAGIVYNHVLSRDWLSEIQTSLDLIGVIPGVGEVSSLVNGFIYLGRMTNACYNWDEKKTKDYQREALLSFMGAIPCASVVKGAIKVVRAERAIRKAVCAERVLSQSRKTQRRAQHAINRVKNKKTTKSKKIAAKVLKSESDIEFKTNRQNLQNAMSERDLRIKETGLTIGELNEVSAGFLANPRKYYRIIMNGTDKVMHGKTPITKVDTLIDAAFDAPSNIRHLWNGMKKLQTGDYNGAAEEFAATHQSTVSTNAKLNNPELTDELDTLMKLRDYSINREERKNGVVE